MFTLALDRVPAKLLSNWFDKTSDESLEFVVEVGVQQQVRHAQQVGDQVAPNGHILLSGVSLHEFKNF
jgi:hypothetical protein